MTNTSKCSSHITCSEAGNGHSIGILFTRDNGSVSVLEQKCLTQVEQDVGSHRMWPQKVEVQVLEAGRKRSLSSN